MPKPGLRWWHVILGTHGSWLPGDPRGFHSRGNRLHSSGDYKTPPPPGEHLGLYRAAKQVCPEAVSIPVVLRSTIADRFRAELIDYRCVALSIGAIHAHILIELPTDEKSARQLIGDAKRSSSRAVRKQLPGKVWSASGTFIPVRNSAHQRKAFEYIRRHETEGCYVWTFDRKSNKKNNPTPG